MFTPDPAWLIEMEKIPKAGVRLWDGAAWLCFPPWHWVCSSILLRVPGMVAVPCVAWSWKQELLHVPQAAPFPCIASSTLYCCQTMIFYGGHLENLKFTFGFCSENECLKARNSFGLKIIDSGSLWQRSWIMNINGPCASFCTDAHANTLYDWSLLLQMILHLIIVPEVRVHCLTVLGCKERAIIEGLILPKF